MKLYRIEELEYDYSPTLIIVDSLKKAHIYLTNLGAKPDGPPHNSWTAQFSRAAYRCFAINECELNVEGENRI